ncbi:Sds3-like-domain-containing protein [Thamnocephalis sphaerospora]|uniref:Sds3-like-domain-containing protein n=1 Tax=Thamnocephalis sphaerospora TaxID=78915 RepID=A0A4P9XXS3_9FUNG|nr:Sds3-like-domain-containing protein [Thamnocephalis sphaerospora]|eukprot:RKP11205.1 Sds3-like-domain-containing protein [Thamnocephalis sphaerospora]
MAPTIAWHIIRRLSSNHRSHRHRSSSSSSNSLHRPHPATLMVQLSLAMRLCRMAIRNIRLISTISTTSSIHHRHIHIISITRHQTRTRAIQLRLPRWRHIFIPRTLIRTLTRTRIRALIPSRCRTRTRSLCRHPTQQHRLSRLDRSVATMRPATLCTQCRHISSHGRTSAPMNMADVDESLARRTEWHQSRWARQCRCLLPRSWTIRRQHARRLSTTNEMPRDMLDTLDAMSDDETGGKTENKRDRRRRMIHERLTRIYTTFIDSKESIYREKNAQYKTELRKLLDGTHDEFQERLSELARQRDETIEYAELQRDYQLQAAEQLYDIESDQAESEYRKDLDELRDRLLQDLEERRRKLREEKDALDVNVDLPYDALNFGATRAHNTRALRKKGQQRQGAPEQKAKRGPRPHLTPLNFAASASDLEEDLLAIQRGSGVKKSKLRR